MPDVSIRKYAQHRGVSHTAVQKAIKQGRIQLTSERRIDIEQADRDWQRNTSPMNAPPVSATIEGSGGGSTYAQSRAVRELYLARLAKIEYEERLNKLVNRDEVKVAAFSMARTIRDSLLNIPDRIAAMLAAESDPTRVHYILTEELRRTLLELTGDGSRSL